MNKQATKITKKVSFFLLYVTFSTGGTDSNPLTGLKQLVFHNHLMNLFLKYLVETLPAYLFFYFNSSTKDTIASSTISTCKLGLKIVNLKKMNLPALGF